MSVPHSHCRNGALFNFYVSVIVFSSEISAKSSLPCSGVGIIFICSVHLALQWAERQSRPRGAALVQKPCVFPD